MLLWAFCQLSSASLGGPFLPHLSRYDDEFGDNPFCQLELKGRGARLPGGQRKLSLVSWLAGEGEGEPTPTRGSGEAIAPSNRALLGLLVGRADTLYNLIHRAPPVTKWTLLPLMILFLNISNEM